MFIPLHSLICNELMELRRVPDTDGQVRRHRVLFERREQVLYAPNSRLLQL